MTIEVKCECGKRYTVQDKAVGKIATCKACGNRFVVTQEDSDQDGYSIASEKAQTVPVVRPSQTKALDRSPNDSNAQTAQNPTDAKARDKRYLCSECGSDSTRECSHEERKRFRFRSPNQISNVNVLVKFLRPRICSACGNVWEPKPAIFARESRPALKLGAIFILGCFFFVMCISLNSLDAEARELSAMTKTEHFADTETELSAGAETELSDDALVAIGRFLTIAFLFIGGVSFCFIVPGLLVLDVFTVPSTWRARERERKERLRYTDSEWELMEKAKILVENFENPQGS